MYNPGIVSKDFVNIQNLIKLVLEVNVKKV